MPDTCIVTGGSSGTGKATALPALSRGYRFYNFDLFPPETEPSESCEIFVKCDVTNRNDVDESVSSVFARKSRVGALVVGDGVYFSANIVSDRKRY